MFSWIFGEELSFKRISHPGGAIVLQHRPTRCPKHEEPQPCVPLPTFIWPVNPWQRQQLCMQRQALGSRIERDQHLQSCLLNHHALPRCGDKTGSLYIVCLAWDARAKNDMASGSFENATTGQAQQLAPGPPCWPRTSRPTPNAPHPLVGGRPILRWQDNRICRARFFFLLVGHTCLVYST